MQTAYYLLDHYKKEIDEIVTHKQRMAWETLRKDIAKHGLRHNIISTNAEKSVSNETNGIEPKSNTFPIKKSKKVLLKQIVPGIQNFKKCLHFVMGYGNNEGYIKIVAMMQKYFDQATSRQLELQSLQYENNEVPLSLWRKIC